MEIPKWAARELTSIADLAMSAIVKNFANLGLLPAIIHFEKFVPVKRSPGGVTSRAAPEAGEYGLEWPKIGFTVRGRQVAAARLAQSAALGRPRC
jgi:hypothetical protein